MKLVDAKGANLREIHETALVHPNAQIGRYVKIGPRAIIGEHVILGDNCIVGPRVVIQGRTTIGEGNQFYHAASIGVEPQENDFVAEDCSLFIGDHNFFREYVTISVGAEEGGQETRIGSDNLLQAYSHVAQGCKLGSHIIIGNCTILGKSVLIEDRAIISGLSLINEFTKIGKMAMIGACTKIVKDIPPFVLVDGNPAKVSGINVVGLRRNGLESDVRDEIKRAYKILYRSNLTVVDAITLMEQEFQDRSEIDHFINFLHRVECGVQR
jgi:UDP-N-acetylglucosamine acyltransferase